MSAGAIRRFGAGLSEGSAAETGTLGGKGAHLCEMAAMGLPVPPGFVLSVEAFHAWRENRRRLPEPFWEEIRDALRWLEREKDRGFGAAERPLLVSVRSGAPVSMPGMMDTILNVGLTEAALSALSEEITPRFARDCRRRLIPMLAGTALDVDPELFEDAIDDWLHERGHERLEDLDAAALAEINEALLALVEEETGDPFPDDAEAQLRLSLDAVFRSWNSRRARSYRAMHGMDDSAGTAAVVQAMVFGNRRQEAATGVAFTRDPNSGAARLYGEYLENAQGEEIVAGLRTPAPLTRADAEATGSRAPSLEERMPEAFDALKDACATLERRYADAQDVEFTIQDGRLWLLQTRTAKRSAQAAIRIAVEMAEADWITREEALLRFNPTDIDRILHPMVDPAAPRDVIARGLPASPGAVVGEVVFTPEEAESLHARDRKAILVRIETSPEDIHGMYAAAGVLTVRGGMTSHAAVVARGLGKPCVCGAGDAGVDLAARELIASDGRRIRTGDILTIDGAAGEALFGAAPMIEPAPDGAFALLMAWADERRRLKVRANADTAEDARIARRLGAEGVGLCRTEHAFFQPGRLVGLREMILAADPAARREALARLLPMQRADFEALFHEMRGLPVCIRLLDPPLHEFLPRSADEVAALAVAMDISGAEVRARAEALREFNPMLGRRGCRVGILFPEVYDMQARAILQAAAETEIESGEPVDLEIMIPFVSGEREMRLLSERIEAMAAAVRHQTGACPPYKIGAMIESPRSALRAAQLCAHARFISLGTNDMTQMVFGLSRDDAGRFMRDYVAQGALACDPFHQLDEEGVGEMLAIAVERGRSARPDLLVGLCGEHGGDPAAVRFCELLKLDYVSCSPFRTPATRLAAAQAAILEGVG